MTASAGQLMRRLAELVVEPRRLLGLRMLPRFLADRRALRRAGLTLRWRDLHPQLGDRVAATPFDPHYLFQAAWIARHLAARASEGGSSDARIRHVDVASDVKVIVTMSAFVPIEFVDVRPLAVSLPGLECRAGDLTRLPYPDRSLESISCLHVIEHIGLGRYGDPLDADGPAHAAAELARVLAPGGRLYVSTPVGCERIEFNAHHVFDPERFAGLFPGLRVVEFAWVDDRGVFRPDAAPVDASGATYACGMYVFERGSHVDDPA